MMAFFEEGVKMKQMSLVLIISNIFCTIHFGMIQLYQIKPVWYIYHLVKIGITSYLTVGLGLLKCKLNYH